MAMNPCKSGIISEINGNIEFEGSCRIGSGSSIAVGSIGNLRIGDGVIATAEFKCVCYHKVEFGKRVTFGWECMVIDTNLYRCTTVDNNGMPTENSSVGYKPVYIGDDCWVAFRSTIMPGTIIAPSALLHLTL